MGTTQELKAIPQAYLSSTPKNAPALKLLRGDPPFSFEYKLKRKTLVHFWATWCAPCVEELPALVKLSSALDKAGIDLVIVSVDAAGVTKVPAFLIKHKIEGTVVYWDPRSELLKKFAISTLPATVSLNMAGQETGRISGAAKWVGTSDVEFLSQKMLR